MIFVSYESHPVIDVFDLESKKKLGRFRELATNVWKLAYIEGKLIARCSTNELEVWDVENMRLITNLTGHTNWVTDFVYADGRLFTCSLDRTIKVWDLNSYTCIGTLEGDEERFLEKMMWNRFEKMIYGDGFLFTKASSANVIKIWNIETEECEKPIIYRQEHPAPSIMTYGDGKLIYCTPTPGQVGIWDVNTKCSSGPFDIVGNPLESSYDHEYGDVERMMKERCIQDLAYAEGKLLCGVFCSGSREYKGLIVIDPASKTPLSPISSYDRQCSLPCFSEGKLYFNKSIYDFSVNGFRFSSIVILDYNPKMSVTKIPVTVEFDAKYKNSLVLCGKGGGLTWEPENGKSLTCHGTNQWKITLPEGVEEFKFVWKKWKKEGGYTYHWEQGHNREVNGSQAITIKNIEF
jgi:WD40 repeat protein